MFLKARFTSNFGETAGLIITSEEARTLSIAQFSRKFPDSEAMKMAVLERSPLFETWEEAFRFDWNSEETRHTVVNSLL